MCYNVQQTKDIKALEKRYKVKAIEGDQLDIFYSITGFAHPKLAVITEQDPEHIQLYKWGLIPFWTPVKNEEKDFAKQFAKNNLNARSESIFDLKSFAPSVLTRRCIIPVTGFYEWREENKIKYPYLISLKNNEIFSLGGIYDRWKDKLTGETINSFSIITTDANPLMSKIHNKALRMPFIIPKERESDWLNPRLDELDIKAIMKPFNENLMQAHTISKRITSRKENPNDPATCEPFEYPELILLD